MWVIMQLNISKNICVNTRNSATWNGVMFKTRFSFGLDVGILILIKFSLFQSADPPFRACLKCSGFTIGLSTYP